VNQHPSLLVGHEPRIEDGMFIGSFVHASGKKSSGAFPSCVDDSTYVPCRFLSLTDTDEARNMTIWMMTNIRAGETIHVKYVLNGRQSSHGLLVWKRRRRRKRPRSGPVPNLPPTQATLAASSELDSWCASSSSAQQAACFFLMCQCPQALCQRVCLK